VSQPDHAIPGQQGSGCAPASPRIKPRILFVAYGGGHVRMVIPVALRCQALGLADVWVLGLTTAADEVRAAGLRLVRFSDALRDGGQDAHWLGVGESLVRDLPGTVGDPQESAAYLGLCFRDLVADMGETQARQRYAALGRQAFCPVPTLMQLIGQIEPALVVATNAPRAERAAVMAAAALGKPAVCLVDLFALDEVRWIGQPGYANAICVLNPAVKDFLISAGRQAHEIEVTGNPAFDALFSSTHRQAGQALRVAQGWQRRCVVIWASQIEPAVHPFDGRAGDPALPGRILGSLLDWGLANPEVVIAVRPRPGEVIHGLPQHERVVLAGQDIPLPTLLHAADMVVTMTSTVGLEGFLCGLRVVQVTGSVFEDAMPLTRFQLAHAQTPLAGLHATLSRELSSARHDLGGSHDEAADAAMTPVANATGRVTQVLADWLSRHGATDASATAPPRAAAR
jgi:Capsule polysaccharide biosynthesis protein